MRAVTQILGSYIDFSRVPSDVLLRGTERGKYVHDICRAILLDMFYPEPPVEYAGYVQSFLKWKERFVKEVVAVEFEVYHPAFRYVGHPDFLGYLNEISGLVILDWKTPLVASKTWRGQVAAYNHAARLTALPPRFPNGIPVDSGGILQLDPDGGIPRMTWVQDELIAFNAFISKLNADRYFIGG